MNYPLHTISNHLFLEEGGRLWLLDTGAPQSFGSESSLELAGLKFDVADNYNGLTASQLSDFVSIVCCGLLGTDIWGNFDIVFDQPASKIELTNENNDIEGEVIQLTNFSGIPIIGVNIDGEDYQMFLDTGAQISYLLDSSLAEYPKVGSMKDFYPGFGSFETDLHKVTAKIGLESYALKFGKLPENLAATLPLAGVQGILGNEILMDRTAGYYPRRGLLVLNKSTSSEL